MKSGFIPAILMTIILGGAFATIQQSVHATSAGKYFDHIVIIAMENKDYNSVIGNIADAPFLNQLVAAGSTMSQYNDNRATFPPSTCSAESYVAYMARLL